MELIPYGKHHLDDSDIKAVVDVLKSDFLTQGPSVEVFEQEVCSYTGAKFAVAVSSGTAALHIAAIAAGVRPGNAVLTSPITFVASANAALFAGGRVIFSDIDRDTINICPDFLDKTFLENSNVKAIIPVHYAGLPCDMVRIRESAEKNKALVIEDAAHALGGRYEDGGRIGNCKHSSMTTFSFHPVKAIAAGEGGLITTNDPVLYKRLLRLRSHGINKLNDSFVITEQAFTNNMPNPWYYEMLELGFNYRMTDIQSALACSQLKKLDKFIMRRKQLVENYDLAFTDLENCKPAQTVSKTKSGNHLYVLRIAFKALGMSRAVFMGKLRENGIGSQVHYIPVPAQPYYRSMGFDPSQFPSAQDFYSEALSIPLYYDLSDGQQEHVIQTIKKLVS